MGSVCIFFRCAAAADDAIVAVEVVGAGADDEDTGAGTLFEDC